MQYIIRNINAILDVIVTKLMCKDDTAIMINSNSPYRRGSNRKISLFIVLAPRLWGLKDPCLQRPWQKNNVLIGKLKTVHFRRFIFNYLIIMNAIILLSGAKNCNQSNQSDTTWSSIVMHSRSRLIIGIDRSADRICLLKI